MNHHDDRSPLLMKVALRQALRRVREEAETLSQYEALGGNLGWEEVAEAASGARQSLEEAAERIADAVEAAVKVQANSAHEHEHEHTHTHSHPHPHPHGHEHA